MARRRKAVVKRRGRQDSQARIPCILSVLRAVIGTFDVVDAGADLDQRGVVESHLPGIEQPIAGKALERQMYFVRSCAIADLRHVSQEWLGQGGVAQHLLEGQLRRSITDHRAAAQGLACRQAHTHGAAVFDQDLVDLRVATHLHSVFGSGAQDRLRDGSHAAADDAGASRGRRVVAQISSQKDVSGSRRFHAHRAACGRCIESQHRFHVV
ncbi:hypothetical protein D3C87_915970 [compost metagenome]